MIDWMRMVEGEGQVSEVNHHGKSITVGHVKGVDTALRVEGVYNFVQDACTKSSMKFKDEAQGRIVMQEDHSLQAGMPLLR